MSKKKDKEHKSLIMAGIKPGLASSKHREKMGPAIWPYLYLLTIPMTDGDDGILRTVQGHKYNRQQLVGGIQEATGLGKAVAYRQFNRLVDEGYLLQREDGHGKSLNTRTSGCSSGRRGS